MAASLVPIYKGSAGQVATLNPGQQMANDDNVILGPPIGRGSNNEVIGFDPFLQLAMANNGVNALTCAVIADIEYGKSTFAKCTVNRVPLMSDQGRKLRTLVLDGKGDAGEPEWQKTIEDIHQSKQIHLRDWRVNTLDPEMGMDFDENLQLHLRIANSLGHVPLNDAEEFIFTTVLEEVLSANQPGTELLVDRLATPTQEVARQAARWHYSYREAAELARVPGMRMNKLLRGSFGKTFGGTKSLKSAYAQDVVGIDMNGLDEDVRVLALTCLSAWKNSQRRHPERGLLFDIEVHDESWQNLRYPIYVWQLVETMKLCREHGTFMMLLIHRLSDLMATGGEAADNIVGDTVMKILGHQPHSEIPVLRSKIRLPEAVYDSLPGLGRGEFWFVMGDQEPYRVNIKPTALELVTGETNSAIKRKTSNRLAMTTSPLVRVATPREEAA